MFRLWVSLIRALRSTTLPGNSPSQGWKATPLPDLPIQYADYCQWQHKAFDAVSKWGEGEVEYWKGALTGLPYGGAKGGIIKNCQIFRHRPVGCRRKIAILAEITLPTGICKDLTGIDGKPFAADQTFRHAATDHGLEELAQEIGLAETAMTGLGEG